MIEPIGMKIEVKGEAYWENPREFTTKKLGEFTAMQVIDGIGSAESFLGQLPYMRRCGKTFWATYEALRLACFGKNVVILVDSHQNISPLMSQIEKHVDLGLQKIGVKVTRAVKAPDAYIEIECPFKKHPGQIFIIPNYRFDEGFLCGRKELNLIDDRWELCLKFSSTLRDYKYKIDSYVTALDLLKRAIEESK